jgi:radical SAM superfamily enzyme YgiQ (UPF0313 family)
MAADLLLAHGYFLYEDEKELQIMKPYPTLGLLYISAYLRRAGIDVEIFDTTFATRNQLEARLAETPGGVVGLYTNLMTRASVLDVIRRAKAHDWTVVCGGPEAVNYPREYLAHGADVVVVGEGEATMAELMPALERAGPHRLHDVRGTVFRDEAGAVVATPDRPQIADLNGIPWPDRDRIDTRRYIDVWREHHGMGSVNLITARGCPYRCKWCSHGVFGFTHRRRSHLDCADELEHIREVYQPDQVWYADDVFTIHHHWLFQYAAELTRRSLTIPFETISRADRLMKDEVLETLKRMGCYRVWIGSESGSQRILDAMDRGVTVEQVQWAVRAARRHGIQVGMFFMLGYDGEEVTDLEATIDHIKACAPDVYFTTVAYPIKGTAYYDEIADRVEAGADWSRSTDRDHAVRGRHSKAYYKHVDAWIRSEVDAARLALDNPDQALAQLRSAAGARAAMVSAASEVEA